MFSVIIPVYNKSQYLSCAVESVRAQTFDRWEIIIVDDGSTDDFAGAAALYLDDPKIKIIRKENGGVSTARNVGIAAAQYPYYCFLDADDEWLEDHLECFRRMIEQEPGAGVYATAFQVSFDHGVTTSNLAYFVHSGIYRTSDLFEYCKNIGGKQVLNTAGTCVSRQAVEKCGMFQPGVRIGEDTDFYLRIAAYYDAVLLDKVTAVYHMERSSAISSHGSLNYEWEFEKRESVLLSDAEIPASKRENIRYLIDHFRNHKARHYLMAGKRKMAKAELRKVYMVPHLRKAMLMSRVMMLFPAPVLRWIYRKKKESELG